MAFSDEKSLATTDGLTVVFSKAEGGKIKLASRARDDGETILPDQVLEVRMRQGQIIFLRGGVNRTRPTSRSRLRPTTPMASLSSTPTPALRRNGPL